MLQDPQINQLYLIPNFSFMCLRKTVISVLRTKKFKFMFLMGPFLLFFPADLEWQSVVKFTVVLTI